MEKLLLKFIRFIKNPLSGFFFYLICISIFLYVPPEGFGNIVFVFMLPFVLFAVIGLNLSFFSTLFREKNGKLRPITTNKINGNVKTKTTVPNPSGGTYRKIATQIK
jgi:hypothetical protein